MDTYSQKLETWLDKVQLEYLLNNDGPFDIFIRRQKGVENFYSDLEKFLFQHPFVKIIDYRKVREGMVNVSRPSQLQINLEGLLHYRPELKLLKAEVIEWKSLLTTIGLEEFIYNNINEMIKQPSVTRACINIFKQLLSRNTDSTWVSPRQIPHSESTKIIGKENTLLNLFNFWRKQEGSWSDFYKRFRLLNRYPEFRIYAPTCTRQSAAQENLHTIIAKSWMDEFDFSKLKATVIVENRETFYALSKVSQNTLIVFGSGWMASQLVDLVPILPVPFYYWGDLDKEGFEILGYLKKHVGNINPVLMDFAAVDKYQKLATRKNSFYGPFKNIGINQDAYEKVCKDGLMIEQEKIPISDFLSQLWEFDSNINSTR